MSDHRINRRRFLRQGATVAVVATATAVGSGATVAAAEPKSPNQILGPSSKSSRTQMRTVVAVSQSGGQAQVMLGDKARSAFFNTWGFPEDYVVAVGEKVVVTDRASGVGQFRIQPLVSAHRVKPDKNRQIVVNNKAFTVLRMSPDEIGQDIDVWTTENQSGVSRVIAMRKA